LGKAEFRRGDEVWAERERYKLVVKEVQLTDGGIIAQPIPVEL
jgi:hypothetical protein